MRRTSRSTLCLKPWRNGASISPFTTSTQVTCTKGPLLSHCGFWPQQEISACWTSMWLETRAYFVSLKGLLGCLQSCTADVTSDTMCSDAVLLKQSGCRADDIPASTSHLNTPASFTHLRLSFPGIHQELRLRQTYRLLSQQVEVARTLLKKLNKVRKECASPSCHSAWIQPDHLSSSMHQFFAWHREESIYWERTITEGSCANHE